ncbi:MAG: hypothetical protein ACRC1K_16440, partial [Planctomycetia bacterium]
WTLRDYCHRWGIEEVRKSAVRDRLPIYRRDLDPTAWRRNLHALGVEYLFITTVHEGERHAFTKELDAEGFSSERKWADHAGFPLIAAQPQVRLYAVPDEVD